MHDTLPLWYGKSIEHHQEDKNRVGMNNPSHSQIAAYLTDHAISELVGYVMEDTGCPLQQAMDTVYNSELMKQLENEETELYVQSPAYLYELMKQLK